MAGRFWVLGLCYVCLRADWEVGLRQMLRRENAECVMCDEMGLGACGRLMINE